MSGSLALQTMNNADPTEGHSVVKESSTVYFALLLSILLLYFILILSYLLQRRNIKNVHETVVSICLGK